MNAVNLAEVDGNQYVSVNVGGGMTILIEPEHLDEVVANMKPMEQIAFEAALFQANRSGANTVYLDTVPADNFTDASREYARERAARSYDLADLGIEAEEDALNYALSAGERRAARRQ